MAIEKKIYLNKKDVTGKLSTETMLSVDKVFGMLLTESDLQSLKVLETVIDGLPENTVLQREIESVSKKTGKPVTTVKSLTVGTIHRLMKIASDLTLEVTSNKEKVVGINKLADML